MTSIEALDVTLSDLELTEVTLFETTLIAKLRITNPNPDPLTIEGGSFKLYLEDKKFGTGTTSESFTVERLDSYVVDVTFHINNASALLRLKDIIEAEDKEISYGLRGGLFTQGAFGTKKLKINKTGTIDFAADTMGDESSREPMEGSTLERSNVGALERFRRPAPGEWAHAFSARDFEGLRSRATD